MPRFVYPEGEVLAGLAAFARHVDSSSVHGCWPSTCATDKDGYGRVKIREKTYRMPRLAWLSLVGPIPEGKVVAHRCDNPKCCRPTHLELVSQSKNIQDCSDRGRHHNSKKTDVLLVRAETMRQHGYSYRHIGRILDVDHQTVRRWLK